MTFPTKEIAQIIANTLDVDKEYCEEISRHIKVEDKTLNIKFEFEAKNIKNLKKSINTFYENLKLIILTIRDFSPNSKA